MLIKVLTNIDTTVIIDDVQDAEVSNSKIFADSFLNVAEEAMACNFLKDECIAKADIQILAQPIAPLGEKTKYEVNIIAYKKNNIWTKLVIFEGAYICNNDGKTIHRIGFGGAVTKLEISKTEPDKFNI